jgi:transcriptional regulator with XRE-family HTH domain
MSTVETNISSLIRRRRRELNLTQAQLAELVGTNQSQVSSLERGDLMAVRREVLDRIVQALGLEELVDLAHTRTATKNLRYCRNPACPCHTHIAQDEITCILPRIRKTADDFCRACGTPMSDTCLNPGCCESVRLGMHCPSCGAAYIEPMRHQHTADKASEIAEQHNRRSDQIARMVGFIPDN